MTHSPEALAAMQRLEALRVSLNAMRLPRGFGPVAAWGLGEVCSRLLFAIERSIIEWDAHHRKAVQEPIGR
jgi:hypothetical protein